MNLKAREEAPTDGEAIIVADAKVITTPAPGEEIP